jgi:hypothetical protein
MQTYCTYDYINQNPPFKHVQVAFFTKNKYANPSLSFENTTVILCTLGEFYGNLLISLQVGQSSHSPSPGHPSPSSLISRHKILRLYSTVTSICCSVG